MPNMKLLKPEEAHKEINVLLEKSELTEEDAELIGHRIKREICKRFFNIT